MAITSTTYALTSTGLDVVRFKHGYEGIKELQHEPTAQAPLAEQASLNRTTIAQLLAMEWVSDNQV